MKDYTATMTISWSFQAKDDDQAGERGDRMLEAVKLQFKSPRGTDISYPAWLGDMGDTEVQVEEV